MVNHTRVQRKGKTYFIKLPSKIRKDITAGKVKNMRIYRNKKGKLVLALKYVEETCPCKNEPVDKCTCKACNTYGKKYHKTMAPSPSNQLKKTFGKHKLKRSTDEILKEIDGGK